MQNEKTVFDNPAFFKQYCKFRQSDAGFNAALEEPAMIQLLPVLEGTRVLDLGCGAGRLCRYIAVRGARHVLGVDCSRRMLSVAHAENCGLESQVEYQRAFIEDFRADSNSFDLVVSSLALHYIADIKNIFRKIAAWLAPDGLFIFSVEHPLFTAGPREWNKNRSGKRFWPIDSYFPEGKRNVNWLDKDVVKYHRTIGGMLNTLISAGFQIRAVVEPTASEELVKRRPELQEEFIRPSFLLIKASIVE
jgi:2-polyprenyl-3-methyl-5-hydroxy-6-metoxy-1,4-benzoquinol methylase